MEKRTVLIINEDPAISAEFSNLLSDQRYGDPVEFSYKRASSWLIEGNSPDLIFLNIGLSGATGLKSLTSLRETNSTAPIIVVGTPSQIRIIVQAVQLGAADYLIAPFDVQQARLAIEHVLENHKRNETQSVPVDLLGLGLFSNTEMKRACEIAKIVAPMDVPVLITGESGVGKEVFARFIHNHSHRSMKPLVKVNCAALPNDLLESELFGYERGAFTGAVADKPGKFEMANGGALLLDEIGEMTPHLQAKLLHILQDGEYSRLGGKRQLRANARILASTNRNLEDAVSKGEFREDLYFRLNVIRIKVPPLRERKQEIGVLSNYFVQKYREKYGSNINELPPAILQRLTEYDWPGNVRQLENVIRRYLILPELDIEMGDTPERLRPKSFAPAETNTQTRPDSLNPSTQQAVPSWIPLMQSLPSEFSSLKEVGLLAAERAEREVVLWMLAQTEWNRKLAARRLNVCYKALLNKIKKWQIQRPPAPPRSRQATFKAAEATREQAALQMAYRGEDAS